MSQKVWAQCYFLLQLNHGGVGSKKEAKNELGPILGPYLGEGDLLDMLLKCHPYQLHCCILELTFITLTTLNF